MLKDKEAGKLVNVVPSKTPQDIYQIVADSVILKLHEHVAEGGYPYAQLWLNYGVKRSTTKRSIMTICYGSTRYSCTDFVVEELTKRKDKGEQHLFGSDIFKPSTYLAGVIWESIGERFRNMWTRCWKICRNAFRTYLGQLWKCVQKTCLGHILACLGHWPRPALSPGQNPGRPWAWPRGTGGSGLAGSRSGPPVERGRARRPRRTWPGPGEQYPQVTKTIYPPLF